MSVQSTKVTDQAHPGSCFCLHEGGKCSFPQTTRRTPGLFGVAPLYLFKSSGFHRRRAGLAAESREEEAGFLASLAWLQLFAPRMILLFFDGSPRGLGGPRLTPHPVSVPATDSAWVPMRHCQRRPHSRPHSSLARVYTQHQKSGDAPL